MAVDAGLPKATAKGELAAGLSGLIAAGMAVTAWAACCVLPMSLSFAGLSLAGTDVIAGQRGWLTGLAAVLLAAGWWMTWRRRRACAIGTNCSAPSRTSVVLLTLGSVLLLTALAWGPLIEPWVLGMIRGAR